MISISSAFATANAALAKKPVYLITIKNYGRAFSNGVSGNLYPDLGLAGLCGCFTSSTGQIIGQPFPIGAALVTLKVPVGATQLQLGINDDRLADDPGSFVVNVNGSPVTVPGTTAAWNWVAGGLNTAFQFGIHDGSAPVVVSGMTAGQIITIQYVSGTVGWAWFSGRFDANGDPTIITGNSNGSGTGTPFPTVFMPIPIYDWLVSLADLKITVADLDGSSNLGDLVFNVQDNSQALTADLASFVFEGKKAQLLAGFQGMNFSDYATLFTGAIDAVDSDNGNLEYKFTVSDINLKKLTQKIYTTGDDGFSIDSKHPKTLNGHPLDILVSALQQAGVPLASIDTAKIYYYRDTIYSGLSYVFTLTSAPVAKDFVENELMKPMGMYLWENSLGLISVNSFYPAMSGNANYTPPTPPVMTLDTTNTLTVPIEGIADLIDQVTFRFDDDGTGSAKFLAESVQNWGSAISKYGLYGGHIIESKGMRSSFQGFFMTAIISRLIFLRYGLKQIVLDPLSLIWTACVLEPGDVIAVTNPYVPDRKAGVLGITAKTFEVMDRTWKFMAGVVEIKLLEINLSNFKQYQITPNTEPSYAADTPTNQGKYMYLSNASGQYSTGTLGNTLG